MNTAVANTTRHFVRRLGVQLEAIYLYGSLAQGYYQPGESDVNLAVVVAEGTSVHALRELFLPIWEEHHALFKRAPLIATKAAFLRHLRLNPSLGHHLAIEGEQLYGPPDLLDPFLPAPDPHDAYAALAAAAMEASAALALELLEPAQAALARRRLHGLMRRIRHEPVTADESPAQLFARVQHYLSSLLARLPAAKMWAASAGAGSGQSLLPGLQSIYTAAGKTVLVFSQLSPQQIVRTDWHKLAHRLSKESAGLQITLVDQLSLAAMFDRPLDLRFRKFQHNWGIDFLPALSPQRPQLMRHAGRSPSHLLVDTLPDIYLTQADDSEEALHKIIHDVQNRVLNIQLEHELLCRFQVIAERFAPPGPVPGRDTPPLQRIDALFQQLDSWTDFYAAELAGTSS